MTASILLGVFGLFGCKGRSGPVGEDEDPRYEIEADATLNQVGAGFVLVETDTEAFKGLGYVVETWEVTPAAPGWFATVLDTNPKFYVARPLGLSAEALDLL